MTKNDGGPAFPLDSVRPNFVISNQGMSLRQYYSGMALQGLLAAGINYGSFDGYASIAYKYADAMLKEDLQSSQGKEDRE